MNKENKNFTLNFFKFGFLILAFIIFSLFTTVTALASDSNGTFCTDNSTCSSGYCDQTNQYCADNPGAGTGVGTACNSPADCGGNHETCVNHVCKIGVLNNPCDPSTVSCGAGLDCKIASGTTNYTCLLSDAPVLPNPSPLPSPSPIPGAGVLPCNTTGSDGCPVGLCKVNGLCLPPNPNTTGVAAATSLSDLIVKVIQIMLAFAGMVAVVFIVIGGYYYMASGGNEETAEKGKKIISNFVIGLVIIILAFTIVTILNATLTGADKVLQKK